MNDYNIIVIGGGVAGMSAARKAAAHGLSVLLLEALYTGGKTVKVKNVEDCPLFPGGVSGEEIADRIEKSMVESGVKILHEKAVSMDLEGREKKVVTDRSEYKADAVIIAAGVRERELGLENERGLKGMGIYTSSKDAERMKGKSVALVGKGNEACKMALEIIDFCPKVYFICTAPTLEASKKYSDKVKTNRKINIYYNCSVAAVEEGMFFLDSITVIDRVTTEFIKVGIEALFVARDTEPDTDVFLGSVRMDDDGAVITDDKLETSIEGVFAAGAVRVDSSENLLEALSDGEKAADSANRYIILKEGK